MTDLINTDMKDVIDELKRETAQLVVTRLIEYGYNKDELAAPILATLYTELLITALNSTKRKFPLFPRTVLKMVIRRLKNDVVN
jgi:hypothetical protein